VSQLAWAFDVEQPSVANHDDTNTVCAYCGRDWGNKAMFDINCHYPSKATYNGMCGTEFWIARRAGRV